MNNTQEQSNITEQKVEGQEQVQEQAAPQLTAEEILRINMANNYFKHCVNSRVVECKETGANPLHIGSVDSLVVLLGQVLNVSEGDPHVLQQQVGAVMQALNTISIGSDSLSVIMARQMIGQAADQGQAFSLIGHLQDVAQQHMANASMNEMAQLVASMQAPVQPANSPMAPFPAGAEEVPAVNAVDEPKKGEEEEAEPAEPAEVEAEEPKKEVETAE
ncbi:hypothetical protein [Aeromonas sp. Y318-3]|uniref:hypothetical protein n=1 Tax=Aeromonas sp. Y318-3 TaxID=2990509 RepID=UPI0022E53C84|nr:hypothetical protein [Aeromonas sp. Y318-3]